MRAAARAGLRFEAESTEAPHRERKIKAAMAWLKAELLVGPRPATELEDLARARGIPHTTLQHAKKRIYAHSERQGNRYFWYLPMHKKRGEKGLTS